jgi:predicted phosphodiesterase
VRLAVLSDIHGNLPALEAVLAEVAGEGVDRIVNLGDIASGPLWPAETVARLRALDLPTIRGNHERQVLGDRATMGASDAYTADRLDAAARAWFAGLPATSRLADGAVFACHGTPASDHDYLLETVTPDYGRHGALGARAATGAELDERLGDLAAEVVLCGHSHMPRVAWSAGRLVVNPGSVGLPGFDETRPHFHIIEAGSPHARWALVERTAAGWQAQLRCTAYDWAAAARKAEAEGRGEWADVLRTGRVGRTEETPP